MNKGIVMEMTQANLVVLTPEGRFMKIPRSSRVCEVGDEIVFTSPRIRWKRPFLTFSSSVAAAVLLCVVAFINITPNLGGVQPIVAYVTLDINPSVEMGIDSNEGVQEIRGLNDDGIVLIQQLDIKGKSLTAVTGELLERVEQKGLLDTGEGDIIISSTKAFEEAKIDDTAVGETVKRSVDQHIQTNHPNTQADIHVASLVAPPDMRQAALSEGVSPGKYAIYLNAKSIGSAVTIDEIKSQSIHTIAQERGGIDKLIDTKKVPQKETLSKLFEEEKRGELDAKLQAQMSKSGNADKDDDKKSNGKSDSRATPAPTPKKSDNTKNNSKATPTPTPKKTNPPAKPVSLNRDNNDRDNDYRSREEERKKQESEEKKRIEEQKKQEEQKKAEEKRRQEEEKKKDEERNKQEELKKKQQETEKKKQEEEKKKEEEKRKLEEAKKKQEEEKKRLEEAKKKNDNGRNYGPNDQNQENDNRDGDNRTDDRDRGGDDRWRY